MTDHIRKNTLHLKADKTILHIEKNKAGFSNKFECDLQKENNFTIKKDFGVPS